MSGTFANVCAGARACRTARHADRGQKENAQDTGLGLSLGPATCNLSAQIKSNFLILSFLVCEQGIIISLRWGSCEDQRSITRVLAQYSHSIWGW